MILINTIIFKNPPSIVSISSIVGPKEGEGPMRPYFDEVSSDILFGQKSWEKAESKLVMKTIELSIKKAALNIGDIDFVFAGDLQNQSTGSSFGVRELGIPFFGLFGACSTMGEALSLASVFVDSGYATHTVACASSHFCAAEKTFRFPLELGTQRPLSSSWTVTGAGACVLGKSETPPFIKGFTTGKIVDMGIKDANNMGAAMAPAAAWVLTEHFKQLQRKPEYYDYIITGDLGSVGSELFLTLMRDEGYTIANHKDCGMMIFDPNTQDTHAGGSGCGCAGSMLSYFHKGLVEKTINRILFIPTGALHSPITAGQGETIPAIAHGVIIETDA